MNRVTECDYNGCCNKITEKSKSLKDSEVKLCEKHEKKFEGLLTDNPANIDIMKMVSFMLNTNLANRKPNED